MAGKPNTHRKAGPECFSPLANVNTPQMRIPPCKACGRPSIGGVMAEMEPVAPVGHPTFTAEFYCHDHNPGTFACMSERLFPVYRVISVESPSRMKIQRLDRAQQEARLKA
jgi:hypothetical protein